MENKAQYFNSEWDEVADIYVQEEEFTRFRDKFILSKSPELRATALDVGCGTGGLSLKLAKKFKRVIGIDISSAVLKAATGKQISKNITFVNADFRGGIFKEKSFDFICAAYLFHHYSPEEIKTGVQEFSKLLKNGGALLIIDICRPERENFLQKICGLALFILYYLIQFIRMQGIIKGPGTFFSFIKLFRNKRWQEHESKVKKLAYKEYCAIVSTCLENCRIQKLLPLNQICIYWQKNNKKSE